MLCDAATVREGLLHIVGGRVAEIRANSFPTRVASLAVALRLVFDREDAERAHTVIVTVRREGGELLPGQGRIEFTVQQPPELRDQEAAIAVPFVLNGVGLDEEGTFLVEISYDDEPLIQLPLRAAVAEAVSPQPTPIG